MNLLLDSHALLWALAMPKKLSSRGRDAIVDPSNTVVFSVASVWELELKAAKGKLTLPRKWLDAARETGFAEWKIEAAEAVESVRLPWHHSDPFDRLLVAQARVHGFTLVTRDAFLASYDVPLLAV